MRDAIAEAHDKGDLSENFEYHAAKREQGRLLGRISFKRKVLENARVIEKSKLKSEQALLNKKAGDTVVVRVPAGKLQLCIESVTL